MHACLQRWKRMRKIKCPVKKRESEMALFFCAGLYGRGKAFEKSIILGIRNKQCASFLCYNAGVEEYIMSKQYIRHNYIRDDISIDFPIPAKLDEVIHEAEAYDTEKNIEFFCIADLIDNMCKGYYAQGKLSKEQWDLISAKYSVNAPF